MTDKLALYNGALRELGERKLTSLAQNVQARRELDSIFDAQAVDTVLSAGLWNFATRTIQLDYSPSLDQDFGYQRAFDRPEDFLRTVGVWQDEYCKVPLLDYRDERGYWYSDLDTIYVSYVSNDEDYGGDLSLWPATFTRYVESWLAARVCMALTQNKGKKQDLEADAETWLTKAKSIDAMDEATRMKPPGTWTIARHYRGGARDRGRRGQLIG